jgi:hypothetical protein
MEKEPSIIQNYTYKGDWRTLKLSDSEIRKLRDLHRDYTVKVMVECIEDAGMAFRDVKNDNIACALFEARAEKFFTWTMRALKEKTKLARDNGGVVVEEERVTSSSSGDD